MRHDEPKNRDAFTVSVAHVMRLIIAKHVVLGAQPGAALAELLDEYTPKGASFIIADLTHEGIRVEASGRVVIVGRSATLASAILALSLREDDARLLDSAAFRMLLGRGLGFAVHELRAFPLALLADEVPRGTKVNANDAISRIIACSTRRAIRCAAVLSSLMRDDAREASMQRDSAEVARRAAVLAQRLDDSALSLDALLHLIGELRADLVTLTNSITDA